MLILATQPATPLTHHIQKINRNKPVAKKDQKVTMLSAVYNICVICIVETLKLLGTAIISKGTKDVSKRDAADKKIEITPKLSRRSNSKVVCVQSIKVDPNWLQKISSRQPRTATSTSSRTSRAVSSTLKTSVSLPSRLNRIRHLSFPTSHRTSSSSVHQMFHRRRSYPLSGGLEVIKEEEEFFN